MCFLLKYGSWKLQLESWNTNHEWLNRTLFPLPWTDHWFFHAEKSPNKLANKTYLPPNETFFPKTLSPAWRSLVVILTFKTKNLDVLELGYITNTVLCCVNNSLEDFPYFSFSTAVDFIDGAYKITVWILNKPTENERKNIDDLIN